MVKLTKPKSFTIDRAKWLRGIGSIESALWRADCGCCLGHYGVACGIKPDTMRGHGGPRDLYTDKRIQMPDMLDHNHLNARMTFTLMSTNDDQGLSAKERERRIKAGFREIGVRVTFTGKGNPSKAFAHA